MGGYSSPYKREAVDLEKGAKMCQWKTKKERMLGSGLDDRERAMSLGM